MCEMSARSSTSSSHPPILGRDVSMAEETHDEAEPAGGGEENVDEEGEEEQSEVHL